VYPLQRHRQPRPRQYHRDKGSQTPVVFDPPSSLSTLIADCFSFVLPLSTDVGFINFTSTREDQGNILCHQNRILVNAMSTQMMGSVLTSVKGEINVFAVCWQIVWVGYDCIPLLRFSLNFEEFHFITEDCFFLCHYFS
jgi:hypothetical protein